MASSSLSGNQVIWIDTKMCRVDRFLYISGKEAGRQELLLVISYTLLEKEQKQMGDALQISTFGKEMGDVHW
ncbi:MAG: hypothetical protein AMK69_20785 [Nitrospira bacterium SG8_3]|nr:MAG: hypothetical protein AMK69_20785 [Nitrospira bacterium SG8_3]